MPADTTVFSNAAKRRIRWLMRRGLLELDILLERFMVKEFDALSDNELTLLTQLLDSPDQEFLAWVNQTEICSNPAFRPLLEKIRQA
ncbi:succinate dehydrogenase assembly factor 2 [Stenoxybacter acetivorans]|uniref:FAD assembly factor SdhE n=1 Tax=Stenoxybacter acetivorans TaxID=422441 RepID=UPI0005655EC1|nr:succinate dehydrogenase assembly factor 2 [Stenoxybacter acetivorans]